MSIFHDSQLLLFPLDKYSRTDIHPRDTNKWNEFMRFHKENPEVYQAFVRLANEAKEKGFTSIGAHLLIQHIRWESHSERGFNTYKICNNHFPYYARLFLLNNPEFEGFFELRKLKE
jgi:hypothetical protein